MKKTLGILAVLGSATALVAYKLKKDEKKAEEMDDIDEKILAAAEGMTFDDEQEFEEKAASKTTSYPNLTEDDLKYLNDISEDEFNKIESLEDKSEKAIQHTIHFENMEDLEKFKNEVINEGYVVTCGQNENELYILNVSIMDTDLILSKIFFLANMAKEMNGQYTGWIIK